MATDERANGCTGCERGRSERDELAPGSLAVVTGKLGQDPERFLPPLVSSSVGLRRSFVDDVTLDDIKDEGCGFSCFVDIGALVIVVGVRQYVDRWQGIDGRTCTRDGFDLLVITHNGVGWIIEGNLGDRALL